MHPQKPEKRKTLSTKINFARMVGKLTFDDLEIQIQNLVEWVRNLEAWLL